MEKLKNAVKLNLKSNKKYSFCTCGKSDRLPFCDNKHREINEEKKTNYKSLKVYPEKDITLMISSSTWENKE